jgi:hypothetical protein
MRILFVLGESIHFRYFDGVVRRLCEQGHEVQVIHGGDKKGFTDRALHCCAADCSSFEFQKALLTRTGPWRRLLSYSRGLRNYTPYLRPDHPNYWWVEQKHVRFDHWLPRGLRTGLKSRVGRRLLASRRTQQALRLIEAVAPSDRAILAALQRLRPDVLVACPYLFFHMAEVEYVKAARALGIPSVVAVASWDNLTSKGTFPLVPDLTLVWNEALAEEAVRFHAVPRSKIAVCGALPFDIWFDRSPVLDRQRFCERVGLDPQRPYLLYLCSTKTPGPPESAFVGELTAALRRHTETREAGLMIRPHPFHASIWKEYAEEHTVIWPVGGEWPDVAAAQEDYYHSLYYAAGVIGLNTSGFLEAAIVNRPCVTIVDDQYRETHSDLGHFRHLLKAGFLEVAQGIPEAVKVLGALLQREDSKADDRRRFVREFIRPCGMEVPASEVAARAIREMGPAERQPEREIDALVRMVS